MKSIDDVINAWFDPEQDGALSEYLPKNVSKDVYVRKIVGALQSILPSLPVLGLGGQDNGYAWQLEDGKVLKLTIDATEALASNTLASRKANHKNVSTFYYVRRIGRLPIFIIIQEYAGEKVTDQQVLSMLNQLYDIRPPDKMIKLIEALENLQNEPGEAGKAAKDLLSAMNWLMDQNIDYTDLNSNNVLIQNGHYKIIDLGISQVVKPKPIDVLSFEDRINIILSPIKEIKSCFASSFA